MSTAKNLRYLKYECYEAHWIEDRVMHFSCIFMKTEAYISRRDGDV